MSVKTEAPSDIDVDVTTRGDLPDVAEYARNKIGRLGRITHRPVRYARVKLSKHHDPAVNRPVVAQAALDVDGRLVRVQVHAATAREAIDRLEARLRRRLEHIAEYSGARRRTPAAPGSWRHVSEPTRRDAFFPRPSDQRQVMRRKSFTMAPCTVDEAIEEMNLLDYDFHMFTEKGTKAAALVSRGPDGYHLALVTPSLAKQLSPFQQSVTVSQQPLPCMTELQAVERLGLLDAPFLFFIEAARGRAGVLYHRYDGHYGMITPAGWNEP